MRDKWKNELNSLHLSRETKQKIVENINKKQVPYAYKFILPSFIVLACFFMYVTLSQPGQQPIVTSEGMTWDIDHTRLYKELIIWQFASLFALIVLLIQLTFLAVKMKRFENNRFILWLQKARTNVFYLFLPMLAITLCIIAIQLLPLFWIGSVVYFQTTTMLFVTLNVMCLFMWQILNTQLPKCPSCHEEISKAELRKMTWMPFNLKCPHCKSNIYVAKSTRMKWGYTSTYLMIIFVAQMLEVPFLSSVCCIIIYTIFLIRYFYVYSMKFTLKDEELW